MALPLVSVITASIGRPSLKRCIESVANQTYGNIQHLVYCDGNENYTPFRKAVNAVMGGEDIVSKTKNIGLDLNKRLDIIELPYSIGKDRWNGHRMYGAGTYIADGDYVMYLDDDNTLDPDHIQNCIDVVSRGNRWSYSLRKIVNINGDFLCNDDCESLGRWPSVINDQDYFVDVNCYFLPKKLAIQISPIWYCKFREPGQPEIDRKLCYALRQIAPAYDCTYKYTVNYAVASNGDLSVKPDFFVKGNEMMEQKYRGTLPWKK